jgi:hypothetical protein
MDGIARIGPTVPYPVVQCCGSDMFNPDPGSEFFHPEPPDPNFFHPGSTSKNLSTFTLKLFLSSRNMIRVVDADTDFLPIPDPGVIKRHRIPNPQHCCRLRIAILIVLPSRVASISC